jgi:hypothetical protein
LLVSLSNDVVSLNAEIINKMRNLCISDKTHPFFVFQVILNVAVTLGVGIFDPIALVLHRLHHLGTEYRRAVLANRR